MVPGRCIINDYVISNQEVQNYLFKQGTSAPGNVNSDNNIAIIREAAVNRIEQYLGYGFSSATFTNVYYDGNGSHIIYLKHRPITALTALTISDSSITTSDIVLNDSYLYYEDGFFSKGQQNIKMTYTAGYTRTTMPVTIRMVALKLCAMWYRLQNRESVSSESREDGSSSTYDLAQETQILASINGYRAQ